MSATTNEERRRTMLKMAAAGVAVAGWMSGATRSASAAAAKKGEEDVAPGEDLMREHGVLRRVMFVYDEMAARLASGRDAPPGVVTAGAGIIRRVIEDYHEKLEEQFLFPRFEKAGREVELVRTLRAQHQAGRVVTDEIVRLAGAGLRDESARARLADRLRAFNRMYRPHAAREDTVLFPAFHEIVGEKAYAELGEAFEDRETKVLGERGFERAVADVAKLEVELGIDDLAKFTPS